MKILFLTQILPYPPDAGPKVKTWNVLRYLADQGHQIILASFVRPEEIEHLPKLEEICEKVLSIPIRRSRVRDIGYFARSLLTKRPFLIERDDIQAMRKAVQQIVASGSIDVIHADQLTMAQFCLELPNYDTGLYKESSRPLRIFDAHNAVWTIFRRMEERLPVYLSPLIKMEATRIKSYEGHIVSEFDHTFAVTENDRSDLIDAIHTYHQIGYGNKSSRTNGSGADKILVIPIAVDTELLVPVVREPGSLNILTLGTLHYPPNADGIRWFVQNVFPIIRQRISGVTLTIVGKNPPPDFFKLAEEHSRTIDVTGYVPDLVPYMRQASLMVVPVLAGGGMRVRILEAFSRAMPVVTTTVGIEGIDAIDGLDVYIGDTPNEFAAKVITLLENQSEQARLAKNGRNLAVQKYDWQKTLEKINVIYGS